MAAEIKNLDTDLQMLVYENYNKFISATDTIKRSDTVSQLPNMICFTVWLGNIYICMTCTNTFVVAE